MMLEIFNDAMIIYFNVNALLKKERWNMNEREKVEDYCKKGRQVNDAGWRKYIEKAIAGIAFVKSGKNVIVLEMDF